MLAKSQESPVDAPPTVVQPQEAAPAVVAASPRVLIVPLVNASTSRDHNPLAFGLPIVLAERMEADPGVVSVNGPQVFTAEQAKVSEALARGIDLRQALALAVARGAGYVVSGTMRGKVEDWTFEVDVYRVAGDALERTGRGVARGNLTVPKPRKEPKPGQKPRKPVYVQSSQVTHRLFAKAAADAFREAGIPLADATVAAVAAPSTNDAYAFLLLSRAWARHFHADTWAEVRAAKKAVAATAARAARRAGKKPRPMTVVMPPKDDSPLAYARRAVLVDPRQPEAQRHLAVLLRQAGNLADARTHLRAALALRPNDVRVMVELGALEVADGNPAAALASLAAAEKHWPKNATVQYWIGRANADLRRTSAAIAAFERSRTLDPGNLASRDALVSLYVDARRYADAAGELAAIAVQVPGDKRVAFLLPAALRAAGMRDEAIVALGDAADRFPGDERFHLFRGDLLREDGHLAAAGDAYVAANRANPANERAAMMARDAGVGEQIPPLAGRELLDAIAREGMVSRRLDDSRREFTLAANDALLELKLRGAEACTNDDAIGAALLAQDRGTAYWSTGRSLNESADAIRRALAAGEGAALTPDEERSADGVLAATASAERDAREVAALYGTALRPLFTRLGCGDADGPLQALAFAAVRGRNDNRIVTMPEVAPPGWTLPVSPVIPDLSYRLVKFEVDNTEGNAPVVLQVDGIDLGTIPAHGKRTFAARLGPRAVCVEPLSRGCEQGTNVRQMLLHDNFVWKVRPLT